MVLCLEYIAEQQQMKLSAEIPRILMRKSHGALAQPQDQGGLCKGRRLGRSPSSQNMSMITNSYEELFV